MKTKSKLFILCGLAVLLVVGLLQTAASSKGAIEKVAFPAIDDIFSTDISVKNAALRDLMLANRKLTDRLLEVVSNEKGTYDNDSRADACFWLTQMRTDTPKVVKKLISVIHLDFMGLIDDIPYGKTSPMDALVRIGKPAIGPLLELMAKDDNPMQGGRAFICLVVIEGEKCTALKLEEKISRTSSSAQKARLTKVLKRLQEKIKQKSEKEKKQKKSKK